MNRIETKRLVAAVSVSLLFVSAVIGGEITPREEGGCLIFENDVDGEYSYPITGLGLVKTGSGNLTLKGTYSSSSAITVRSGTLSASPNLFTGAPRPEVFVEDGATFDVTGSRGSYTTWTTVFPRITIAGSGVGGEGALKRLSSGQLSYLTGELVLAGNAAVNIGETAGFKKISLEGHTLVQKGSGTWHIIGGDIEPKTDAAAITVTSGNLLIQNAQNGFNGTEKNVLTADGLQKITLSNVQSKEIPWSLVVDKAMTLSAVSDNSPTLETLWSRWVGPITLRGVKQGLTLESDANHALNIVGAVSGEAGANLIVSKGVVCFHDSVNLAQSGSWSGEINVSANAKAMFVGGTSGGSGEIVMNAGSVVEFSGNGYFGRHIGNGNYVRGNLTSPARIVVTNSVFDSSKSTMLGDVADCCGIFEVRNGAVVSNHLVTASCNSGYAYSAVYQDGGSLYADRDSVIGRYAGNYGYWELNAGAFSTKTAVGIGEAGAGVLRIACNPYTATVKTSAAGGKSEILVSGGKGSLVVDLIGSAAPSGTSSLFALEGEGTSCDVGSLQFYGVNAVTGLVAVADGATLKASRIMYAEGAPRTGSGVFLVHVNGGAIEQTYGYGWSGDEAKVLEKPFVVHEDGCVLGATAAANCTMPFRLVAPTGYVVASVSLPTTMAFAADKKYIGPPVVKIEGAGEGAAAVAVFDRNTRTITGIRVISPGTGYAASGTVAKITSSDGKVEYECPVNVKPAPTAGVGLSKRGSTTMTITSHNNTYNGNTSVEEGNLRMYFADSLPAGSGLSVAKGAVLDLRSHSHTVPTVEGLGIVSNTTATLTVTERVRLTPKRDAGLLVTGGLKIADGAVIELTEPLPEKAGDETYVLLEAEGGVQVLGDVVMPEVSDEWIVRVQAKAIVAKPRKGLVVVFR